MSVFLSPMRILFVAVVQLAGGVNVVVTGPQLLKVYPSEVVMLGMVAVGMTLADCYGDGLMRVVRSRGFGE